MRRVPSQWFLPLFHFMMDAILVAVLIFQNHAEFQREKRPRAMRVNRTIPVGFSQEQPGVEFDMRYIDAPPSRPLALLLTSSVPAVLISVAAIPTANFQRYAWQPSEWWWLTLHELIAISFWFLLGSIADRGKAAVYRWCFALVLIRILSLSIVASPIWRLGQMVQILFWLTATISGLVAGSWVLIRRARGA